MSLPSTVHRSGDALVVRSVVSGTPLHGDEQQEEEGDEDLPQCKIKRNYSCNSCSFFSQNPRSYLYHTRDVHNHKIKIYECPNCLYASKHSQKLQRHMTMLHTPGKIVTKMVKKKPVLKKKEVIIPKAIAEEERDKEIQQQPKLEKKCSMCPYVNKSLALLRRHERIVHLKKRFFRCAKCSYVTHVKARFTKHVKYHSMPMIKCDLCDFKTPYKWNLDRHYKNHSGKGAFQCSKCNFRADIKQSLTVHEMNHHVPPVGQGAVVQRKKNKVGASETTALESDSIDQEEKELLRLEREDGEDLGKDGPLTEGVFELPGLEQELENKIKEGTTGMKAPKPVQSMKTTRVGGVARRESAQSHNKSSDFIDSNDIVPRYGQIYVKNLKCKFCSYKAVFNHEIWRHEKKIHGYIRVENREKPAKRPPPSLIPIQNKSKSPMVLKIPNVKKTIPALEVTSPEGELLDDKQIKALCKTSCLTSSLKDFASLIGEEDAFKQIAGDSEDENKDDLPRKQQTEMLKRKNASFFDKLKEKLVGSIEEYNLICEYCGHESKCLSESLAHQERHENESQIVDSLNDNEIKLSGTELSSTRCQHCRQRCKTSSDLINHLKGCKAFEASLDQQKLENEEMEDEDQDMETRDEDWDDSLDRDDELPMENRIFVWNELPEREQEDAAMEEEDQVSVDENVLPEVEDEEPIPGYGAITNKGSDNTESGMVVTDIDPDVNLAIKKVFKCPHCSFWASTASRFHVHIVGHLNKKPFECSLCQYRSNWRWDITKHIRLKSVRDPTHLKAEVFMTDETGRRNYSKYNKYLTMMRVQEPNAESSGTGKRTRTDLTQGTVHENDLLPSPPKLTRAPAPGARHQPHSIKPPPLIKAHSSTVKKTMWKCKKCNFRHSTKEEVLAHVKKHYSTKSVLSGSGDEPAKAVVSVKPSSYVCGHCNQRHCKLKHNGDVEIHPLWRDEEAETEDQVFCNICPYSAKSDGDLTAHKLNHVDRPGSIFKCTYCPFYVPSKIAVLEHMEIHGIENVNELASLRVDNFDPSEDSYEDSNDHSEISKRFKCRQCPYVSNSKSQFLYHKQFHRPRNAQFKCLYCTYNVTRRHLLHQHLRVHHKTLEEEADPPENQTGTNRISINQVPLVWVYKANTFLKMYKCRWCPQTNLRKINVLEHEKMHREREQIKPTNLKLKCTHCNYTCSNPGVLSVHIKVHQGFCGEIRSLVDPTRTDEDQLRDLQDSILTNEPEVIIKSEPNSDDGMKTQDEENKQLHFCNKCPARFFCKKELKIHSKFHSIRLPFRCGFCCYTARQKPHLLSHHKVHTQEYQERTANLVDSYIISNDNPRPNTIVANKKCDFINGPIWTVMEQVKKEKTKSTKPVTKLPCPKCPATFFKSVALQYHLTLHNGNHQHKCKYCDYTVKTYGNLIKHQLVHEPNQTCKPIKIKNKPISIPILGTGLFQRKSPPVKKVKGPKRHKTDPQFGPLMHGSPEFIYPTYLKNGKIKEKRYKCHKCPSAFEKRDQYKIHLSLHGSKQKYTCEICEYSVKYYANYVQHTKKHQDNEDAIKTLVAEGKEMPKRSELEDIIIKKEIKEEQLPPITLTLSDQQILMLLEKKKQHEMSKEEDKRTYWCYYCPYSSNRRDAVENHTRRHFCVSGIKSAFECAHCDYTATQINYLREHNKLHFSANAHTAEAFLKCDKMELWAVEENIGDKENAELLFRDNGEEADRRFEPEIDNETVDIDNWKIYVNPLTGEPHGEDEIINEPTVHNFNYFDDDGNGSSSFSLPLQQSMEIFDDKTIEPSSPEEREQDLLDMIEEVRIEKPKVKRWREKNLKCNKCPHAFSKKDQYIRHIALHGSNQKHTCDICDYSVKFYTNYIQHMKMHQSHEPERIIELKPNIPDDPPLKKSGYAMTQNDFVLVCEEEAKIIDSHSLVPA